ncbi:coiled-coil domain-containing protein 180 isoform X2 [Hyperolius riggenbachi]|uniref:coiled-coil domain-containing protein 180 isoform X2 n=1 Tax=Hyperolius riggenbachi TaxID=752182 RepID=UPI0035A2AB77
MAVVGQVHVVPSGKVYRQIFDAEVQLVRSLGEARARGVQYGVRLDSARIPLVHDGETRSAGLLSPRQRHWVDSMPYDSYTENPIVSREKSFWTLSKTEESEDEIAAREVRGLCDVVVPEKTDSGILQRITASRQERHDKAVIGLQKELADISKEMEPLVLQAGRVLQANLSESDKKMEQLFQQCEERRENRSITMAILNGLWDELVEESSCRREWISHTEKTLSDLEEKRAEEISDVLKTFTALLEEISYLLPSDVHRFIHKEAMMINQAILANHRAISRLSLNLMEAELKRECSQRLRWQDLIKAWKSHEKERVVLEFRQAAQEEAKRMPGSISREADLLMDRYQPLHDERHQLLCSVSGFIPPACTKSAVTDWHKSLLAVNKDVDSIYTGFLDGLDVLQKDAVQRFVAEADACKAQLVTLDVCRKEEAEAIMAKELSPVLQQFQIRYDKERQIFSDALKTASNQMETHANKLFRYAKKAAHLWDVLEIGLSLQEKSLQKDLDRCRKKHEADNQAKEASLDIILDSLRQGNTVEQLRALLEKALACLQDIQAGYRKCHKDQVTVVETYPGMVLSELLAYSSSVSKFFHVEEVYGKNVPPKTEVSESQDFTGGQPESREPSDAAADVEPTETAEYASPGRDDLSGIKEPHPSELEKTDTDGGGHTAEVSAATAHADSADPVIPSPGPQDVPLLGAEMEAVSPEEGKAEAPAILESFVTSRGNTYTVLTRDNKRNSKSPIADQPVTDNVFFTEAAIEEESPINMNVMLVPEHLIAELKKSIRLGFYEHLEGWFDETVSSSHSIVLAKEEELKSELELRCHLHEPRGLRIEMDVHNVRAAELLLHSERVDRHCEGVNEALNTLKEESALLIERMKSETESFRYKISSMESIFLNANKSDKLVTLSNSLSSILDSHVSGVQTTMRNYRQHVEEMLGKLCDTNSDFIKSFRLFSEGGNFSPDEIETLRKRLHAASATIASFESSIMVDLEGLESLCLEKATEVVKKFEDKFLGLTADMIFLENIQKLLTNLQVKIKALVVSSNSQSQQINTYLEQLRTRTDACANPNMDKEVLTSQDLYDFAKVIMEELSRRSRYLSCLLEPTPVLPDVPLQGPIAAAARVDGSSRQDGKAMYGTPDSLLNPSRIGKLALDDVAVTVIKNIMRTQQTSGESTREREDGNRQPNLAVSRAGQPMAPHPPSRNGSANKKKPGIMDGDNKFAPPSLRKLVKPSRFDKKYQVFGEQKEESDHFKGILTSILWESNYNLLYMAEEFYKKKDRRPIGRPDLLQDTFEDCADMLVLKLQSYEKQALEYLNNCLLEFREQLVEFEKQLCDVPKLVIDNHRQQHLEVLQTNVEEIRLIFRKELDKWNQTKEEMKNVLRPSLGHPDNCQTLEEMCRREERRQQEEEEGIERNSECLQACVLENTDRFVTSLASLGESILLDLDETLTVDDVLTAKKEIPKEKLSTLIRRKQAGLPLEDTEYRPLIERGSRVWPGISLKNPADMNLGDTKEGLSTASVTTAKTTLSHVSTTEARDSAYQRFLGDAERVLASITEQQKQHNMAAQRWKEWWGQSILKIKELYS